MSNCADVQMGQIKCEKRMCKYANEIPSMSEINAQMCFKKQKAGLANCKPPTVDSLVFLCASVSSWFKNVAYAQTKILPHLQAFSGHESV